MEFCKGGNGLCLNKVEDGTGYCDDHGGRARHEQELEALRPQMRTEQKDASGQPRKFVPEKPKGQAVSHNEGLSQFGPKAKETDEEREKRLDAERKDRDKRDAKRKKRRDERNANRPKQGESSSPPKWGGHGTSRKAKQAHKRRRNQAR